MRPPGPGPTSVRTSTPCVSASARARGEILICPPDGPPVGAAPPAAASLGGAGVGAPVSARGAPPEVAALDAAAGTGPGGGITGRASPASPISAIGVATETVPPSATRIRSSTPDAGASTSTVALSVITSKRGSPFLTGLPSGLIHRTTVPSSCVSPSRGNTTSVGIRPPAGGRRSR